MSALQLRFTTSKEDSICGTIGGAIALPKDSEWPRCRLCDDRMIAFVDLELPKVSGSPFDSGSRLQIFACRAHDDIAGLPYTGGSPAPFYLASQSAQLPANYWTISDGHYLLRLLPPESHLESAESETRLLKAPLTFTPMRSDDENGFKLFGQPYWVQDPEVHTCCCGAPMTLLLQIPDGSGFQMAQGAPEQSNSFSKHEYCLFLGNQLYLLACTRQCHPLALWPVLQN